MSEQLRHRYATLLRCYPKAYRAEHGAELVDLYLDLARPGQRRPRPGDVADIVRGGLRQHLRARRATGLLDALPFAGALALVAAAAIAGALLRLEAGDEFAFLGWHRSGPFVTQGGFLWAVWLLPPLAATAGRPRPAVLLAVAATVAFMVTPMSPNLLRPPLYILVPQLALGLLALAVPARRPGWAGLVTGGAALAAAGLGALLVPSLWYYQQQPLLLAVALATAVAAVAAGAVFAARRDRRGFWPPLLLLAPVLLLLQPTLSGSPEPLLATAALLAALDVLGGLAVLALALWSTGRRRPAAVDAAAGPGVSAP